jgi:hypothetical protein
MPVPEVAPPPFTWFQKFSAVLFCVFCFELGLFLLIYPWAGAWNTNYFLTARPEWRAFLLSEYFRGAVSGLGVLNILIAFSEVYRLRRFAAR